MCDKTCVKPACAKDCVREPDVTVGRDRRDKEITIEERNRHREPGNGVAALSGLTRVISETPQTDAPPKQVKVLFAEDEDLVRLMLADVLREEGFLVFEASDAAEAISTLKAMPVDVVITDLRMRTIADGLELAAYVRAHCRGVSLVGASAYAPPITEDLAFDAFFIKPYNPEDIANWIRRRHGSTRCADGGLP